MQTLIEKLEVLLEAAKTGKPVELRNSYVDSWATYPCVQSFITGSEVRLKPTPKLRPWRLEEVPLEGWFRTEETLMAEQQACVKIRAVRHDGIVLIGGIWHSLEELLAKSKWTLTPFDAASWKSCGVEE